MSYLCECGSVKITINYSYPIGAYGRTRCADCNKPIGQENYETSPQNLEEDREEQISNGD